MRVQFQIAPLNALENVGAHVKFCIDFQINIRKKAITLNIEHILGVSTINILSWNTSVPE